MSENPWAPYLDADERILWEGAPKTGILLSKTDVFLIPFSLLWGGFALVWNGIVWMNGAPFFFKLWGLPFLLAGFYIVIGRFFASHYIRRHTIYAVSTKRAFIAKSAFGRKLREKPITKATQFDFSPGPNGTIILDPSEAGMKQMHQLGVWVGETGEFEFRALRDADQVYRILRDVQRNDSHKVV